MENQEINNLIDSIKNTHLILGEKTGRLEGVLSAMDASEQIIHEDMEDMITGDFMSPSCPECGSRYITGKDEEGIVDCLDCGVWHNPLDEFHGTRWAMWQDHEEDKEDNKF